MHRRPLHPTVRGNTVKPNKTPKSGQSSARSARPLHRRAVRDAEIVTPSDADGERPQLIMSVTADDIPQPTVPSMMALAAMDSVDEADWYARMRQESGRIARLAASREVGLNLALMGNAEAQSYRLINMASVVRALEAKVFSPEVMADMSVHQLVSLYRMAVESFGDTARLLMTMKDSADFASIKDKMEALIRAGGSEVPVVSGSAPASDSPHPTQAIPGHLAAEVVYLIHEKNKTVH